MLRIGDFVLLREVSPVVQLTEVRDADRTEQLPKQLLSLLDSYLVVEGANAAAVHGLLSALNTGGAFFVSGVYGTGKSHLFAVLGLLAEFPEARRRFVQRYPTWAPLLEPLGNLRFFVTYISLDEFDPTAFALEAIVAQEVAAEAQRKNFFVPTETAERARWLNSIWQAVSSHGFVGMVLLLDELAMFLNAKNGQALNRDASFLQFLAQATKRLPLLLVGALQRGLEELQQVEPYALAQVRDRFRQTWVLGLAHASPLIEQVLVQKRNEQQLRQQLQEMRLRAPWAQRFSVDELVSRYPFHPLTVRCLERSVGVFFSRTRSIVTFVQETVRKHLDAPWHALITPDALIDHFEPDFYEHPQLRPFVLTVLPSFRSEQVSPKPEETLRLVKALLAFQLGGEEPSALLLAEALMKSSDEIWATLERLRTEANFVDATRRTGSPEDTYRLDPQITVTRAFRQRLVEATLSLSGDDPRLMRFGWECRSDEWMLPSLSEPRTFTVHWMQSVRRVSVTVTDLRHLTEAQVRQTVANLASPAIEECLHLFFGLPVAINEQLCHFAALLEAVKETIAFEQVATDEPTRFVSAVVGLVPREPNEAEQRRWVENTALWLLAQDLSLSESELGMKVLERVREMLPARQRETQRLWQRLYGDGTIVCLVGSKLETLPMRKQGQSEFPSLDELVQRIANLTLPFIFPRFPSVAPRREASLQTLHDLARLIARGLPPALTDTLAERWLEAIAIPLGIVARRNGQLRVTVSKPELPNIVMAAVGSGASYRQVALRLAKSPFGLPLELTQLVVAALVHLGWLVATDRSGKLILPENLSTPFIRTVAQLQPAHLLDSETWQRLRPLLSPVLLQVPETLTPETQQRLWNQLREKAKDWNLRLLDINARLDQWQRELKQTSAMWQQTLEVLHQCYSLTVLTGQPVAAAEGLQMWAKGISQLGWEADQLAQWQRAFDSLAEFFAASSQLLDGWRYLRDMQGLTEDFEERRQQLMGDIRVGEGIVHHWQKWLADFQRFRDDYIAAYLDHHDRVHRDEKWARLWQLKQGTQMSILTTLSSLPNAPREADLVCQQLDSALEKHCQETRSALRQKLLRNPCCPRCGLTLDGTVKVDEENLFATFQQALTELKAWFCASEQRERLRRFLLVAKEHERSALEELLRLTVSDERGWLSVVSHRELLHTALLPLEFVVLDLKELSDLLEGRCLTCDEAVQLFRQWLESKVPGKGVPVLFSKQGGRPILWQTEERTDELSGA